MEQARRRGAAAHWRPAAIAAAVALFVLGAGAGYLVPLVTGLVQPVQVAETPNWRQAVAEYMGLMTPETLAIIADNPAALADELSAVGDKLSLDLTPDRLALPDVALKRATLYAFRGKPLAQLAYLSPAEGRSPSASSPTASRTRRSPSRSARASTSSSGTATASATC